MQKVTNLGNFLRNRLPSAQNVPLRALHPAGPSDLLAPQKKRVVVRFIKAPWPVAVFQQVRPFSAEAHTRVR